jgi:hypothetical protein
MASAQEPLLATGDLLVSTWAGEYRIDPKVPSATLSSAPLGTLTVAPDGAVYQLRDDVVSLVDLATGDETPVTPFGPIWGGFQSFVVGSDGSFYALTSGTSGGLYRVDPAVGVTEKLASRLACLVDCQHAWASGIAVAPDGGFFLTLEGYFEGDPGYVLHIDTSGNLIRIVSRAGSLMRPAEVVVDADGSLLIPDSRARAILRVDPVSGEQSIVAQGGKLLSPFHLARGDNGKLYLSELSSSGFVVGGSQVVEVDPATGLQRILMRPVDVGDVFVAPGMPAPPACADDLDNDGDRRADYGRDRGCTGPHDGTEQPVCADGLDNDGDGLIDYAEDPGCESDGPKSQEAPQCNDGRDNDGDGWYDYPEDPECASPADNAEHWLPKKLRPRRKSS